MTAPRVLWRDVALLALVSFLADVSGEMLLALLPFLLLAQGAGGLAIGLVDGVTEGVGHLFKFIGGQAGARVRRQRLLIGSGYLLATLSRFGVALSATWPATLAFRSLDRVGKGVRTAPRDAMLARLAGAGSRARAFALHTAGDTAGGVAGVLLALALVSVGLAQDRIVLLAAAIGVLAIVPLFWVRDRPLQPDGAAGGESLEPRSPLYGLFLVFAVVLGLGRLGTMFYVVHAVTTVPALAGPPQAMLRSGILLYLLCNLVQAVSALGWGRLADAWGKRRALAAGGAFLAAAPLALVGLDGLGGAVASFALLGLGLSCLEGNSRALAAELAGAEARITKLGEFHAMVGFASLLGGVAAGLLWEFVAPSWAFVWGAAFALAGAGGMAWLAGQPQLPAPTVPAGP